MIDRKSSGQSIDISRMTGLPAEVLSLDYIPLAKSRCSVPGGSGSVVETCSVIGLKGYLPDVKLVELPLKTVFSSIPVVRPFCHNGGGGAGLVPALGLPACPGDSRRVMSSPSFPFCISLLLMSSCFCRAAFPLSLCNLTSSFILRTRSLVFLMMPSLPQSSLTDSQNR
jgi:hypothetical protein